MSKRIVLCCWGSYGDLFPHLSLARHLKALGHVPVLVTCAYYRDLAERAGIEFHPMRPDVDPGDSALIHRIMDPASGSEVLVRDVLVRAIRQSVEDLSAVVRGADLLVGHPVAFAVPLVAGVTGIPWLSVVLAPTSMFSVYDFPLLPPYGSIVRVARAHPGLARVFLSVAHAATRTWTKPIRDFRRELGLPDGGDPLFEGQFSPHGTLALFSRVLGSPQPDWPRRTTLAGFVFYEDDRELPAKVAAFVASGDPPIVFTLGSSAIGAPGRFYEESIEAARKIGRRAVLLVGPDSKLATQSVRDDLCIAEYAPHGALFKRAVAVVHHGGVGTLAQALRAGKPMLVVPHAHDQPDNALRAERSGVARVLDARQYTAARASAALLALVSEHRYRSAGEEVSRAIASERGPDAAVSAMFEAIEAGAAAKAAS